MSAADQPTTSVAGVPPPVATVGRRARGALVDLCVILGGEVGALIVGGILVAATGGSSALARGHLTPAAAVARAVTQALLFIGPGMYLYVSWSRGGSVGMRAVHCRLRSSDGLSNPTSSQVLLRLCGLWFSVVGVGVGLLWGLVRSDRRGWPDLFAGTVVVHLTPAPVVWLGWGGSTGGTAQEWQSPWWTPPVSQQAPPSWQPPATTAASPPGLSPPPPPWPITAHLPPVAPPHPPGTWLPPVAAAPWSATPLSPPIAPPPSSPQPLPRPSRISLTRTPWTWTDVAPVVVLLLPLSFGVEYATVAALKWLFRGASLATRRPIEATASDITAYGAVLLLVLLFVKVRRHAPLTALGLRRTSWRWLLAAIPFSFAAFLLESITGLLSQGLFPQTPSNQCVSIRDAYQGALPLAVLGVAVVAPLVEEIVFRGMVFGWLRGRAPIGWAVGISAALFSLEHIGFLQLTLFLPIFAAGLVLATLYHHSQSIWPTVLVHGTFNLVATLVLFNAATC